MRKRLNRLSYPSESNRFTEGAVFEVTQECFWRAVGVSLFFISSANNPFTQSFASDEMWSQYGLLNSTFALLIALYNRGRFFSTNGGYPQSMMNNKTPRDHMSTCVPYS